VFIVQRGEDSAEDDVQLNGITGHLASCSAGSQALTWLVREDGVQHNEFNKFKPIYLFKIVR
jgi:hypothetical protein